MLAYNQQKEVTLNRINRQQSRRDNALIAKAIADIPHVTLS